MSSAPFSITLHPPSSLLVTLHSPQLLLFWTETRQLQCLLCHLAPLLLSQSPVPPNQFLYTPVPPSPLDPVMTQITRQLEPIKWLLLPTLKLHEPERAAFFFNCKLVKNTLSRYFKGYAVVKQNIERSRLRKGALLLFYDHTSERLAQDKSYELEGLNRETVTLVPDGVGNLDCIRLQERSALLKAVTTNYSAVLNKIFREVQYIQVLNFSVNKNGNLQLEYVGLQKNLYRLYEKVERWLSRLRFKIVVFSKVSDQRKRKLEEMIQELNQKKENQLYDNGIRVNRYIYSNQHVIGFDCSQLHEDLHQYINSEERQLFYKKEQIQFIEANFHDLQKELKRDVDLFGITIIENSISLVSDSKNYMKAHQRIGQFLANRIMVDCQYWFRKPILKHAFLKYFAQKISIENIQEDPQDPTKILYKTKRINDESVRTILTEKEGEIRKNTARVLVPENWKSPEEWKCTAVTEAESFDLVNPILSRGLQIVNCNNPIRIRFIKSDDLLATALATLICPYYGESGEFLSKDSGRLMTKYEFLPSFTKCFLEDFKKRRCHTFINDSDCNIKEIMCCGYEGSYELIQKCIEDAVKVCLEYDGLGLMLPDGKQMRSVLNIFLDILDEYRLATFSQKKPALKNVYLVCESDQVIQDVRNITAKEMKTELKIPPLRVQLLDIYGIKILPHNILNLSHKQFKISPLTSLVVAIDKLVADKNQKNIIINLPPNDGAEYEQIFVDYEAKRAYNLTECLKMTCTQLGSTISRSTHQFVSYNYGVMKKRIVPRVMTLFLRQNQIIPNYFKVTQQNLIKVVNLDGNFIQVSTEDPDHTIPYTLQTCQKKRCKVLEGYAPDLLSMLTLITK